MMYPWVLFAAFRQRIYAGMTLAESVCTSAGLGAYPVQGKNRTGHGPTVGYLKLKKMLVTCKYIFITLKIIPLVQASTYNIHVHCKYRLHGLLVVLIIII